MDVYLGPDQYAQHWPPLLQNDWIDTVKVCLKQRTISDQGRLPGESSLAADNRR